MNSHKRPFYDCAFYDSSSPCFRSCTTGVATELATTSFKSVLQNHMAAANVLLTAAGLLKTSTATELATSSSQPDPAASTDDVSLLPLTGLKTSNRHAFLFEDNDLERIVALLLWMAQDFQSKIRGIEIHVAALETLMKHMDGTTKSIFGSLHTSTFAKLSKLIDIMMLHKDGRPKDPNATLHFMRRVAKIREELLDTSSDNATERLELDEAAVSVCYQRFGRALLTNDLLSHQKQDSRYCLRNKFKGDTYLSGFQRSFTDNMLRKFLGDKKVATLIWQHGIPSLVDRSVVLDSKVLNMGMLQSALYECLQWYGCLANDIVVHQTQKSFGAQLSASSLNEQERQRQQTRRQALQKARDALRLGAALAKQKDRRKRSYDDMNDAEQKTLEDYETGRTKKARQDVTIPRMKPFRCKMQFNE
jgi:hypothetical protein